MTGEIFYEVRAAALLSMTGVPGDNYVLALLSGGVELSGNGYGRTTVIAIENPQDASTSFWNHVAETGGPSRLLQNLDIEWASAASGANWTFDEIRIIKPAASGSYLFRFVSTLPFTVADGNTLVIPAGSLVIQDASDELS